MNPTQIKANTSSLLAIASSPVVSPSWAAKNMETFEQLLTDGPVVVKAKDGKMLIAISPTDYAKIVRRARLAKVKRLKYYVLAATLSRFDRPSPGMNALKGR